MAEKIQIHKRNVEARLKSLETWKTPKKNKTDLVQFLQDLEMGKVNRGRKISIGRQSKKVFKQLSLIYNTIIM